jgi:hypothetical protein
LCYESRTQRQGLDLVDFRMLDFPWPGSFGDQELDVVAFFLGLEDVDDHFSAVQFARHGLKNTVGGEATGGINRETLTMPMTMCSSPGLSE